MAFKDLLVYVESGKVGQERGRYAVQLAAEHGAHLTAVSFAPSAIVPTYGEPGIIAPMPQTYFEDLSREAKKALDEISEEAAHQGVTIETRQLDGVMGDLPQLLSTEARYSDFVITGQPQGDAVWSNKGELISRLLLTSGRPVLVIPYIEIAFKQPEVVLAAWDGSAEAARSFHDALPMMKAAKKTLLYIGEPSERLEVYGDEPGADIARHLTRHGVEVEVRRAHSDDLSVGELILSRVVSDGVDLIVMGGFHHSRLRELLIGGVTKTVLEQTSVPVFMSH